MSTTRQNGGPQTPTENLLQLHDARVGPDVVDRVGGLGLVNVLIFKDIIKGQILLGGCHGGQSDRQ